MFYNLFQCPETWRRALRGMARPQAAGERMTKPDEKKAVSPPFQSASAATCVAGHQLGRAMLQLLGMLACSGLIWRITLKP